MRLPVGLNAVGVGDTVIYSGPCILERITVNTAAAGTLVVYDNTEASGTKVLTASAPAVGTYELGLYCATGVTVSNGAAHDLSVVVRGVAGQAVFDPGDIPLFF